MPNLKDYTDEQLFSGGAEQPGSQMAYDRQIEVQRRTFMRDMELAQAQIEAARATKRTATWTMVSAIAIGLTVVVTGFGIWVQMLAN